MKRNRLLLLLALVAAPAGAIDRVGPGVDLWTTRGDGSTFVDFAANPIPAGFFCAGSEPFTGRVEFKGRPIVGGRGGTDTIVERLDEATFDERGVGIARTRVRAIQLESLAPLATSCGKYTLRVALAPGEQPLSRIRLHRTAEDGGHFTSTLALNVRMTFQPLGKKGSVRTLDDTISFDRSTNIPWSSAPTAAFADRAMTVDTNADGKPDTRLVMAAEFAAGWLPGSIERDGGGGLIGAFQASNDSIVHAVPEHGHYVDPSCGRELICPILVVE
jgi:hypothetical protein